MVSFWSLDSLPAGCLYAANLRMSVRFLAQTEYYKTFVHPPTTANTATSQPAPLPLAQAYGFGSDVSIT